MGHMHHVDSTGPNSTRCWHVDCLNLLQFQMTPKLGTRPSFFSASNYRQLICVTSARAHRHERNHVRECMFIVNERCVLGGEHISINSRLRSTHMLRRKSCTQRNNSIFYETYPSSAAARIDCGPSTRNWLCCFPSEIFSILGVTLGFTMQNKIVLKLSSNKCWTKEISIYLFYILLTADFSIFL